MTRLMSGPVAMATYCISTAVSAVWVMFSFNQMGGAALTFLNFVFAWLVFLVVNLASGGKPLRLLVSEFKTVAWLNLLTLTSWWFMFMALQRIEASVESAIYQGWLPLVVLACEFLHGRVHISRTRALGAVLIFLAIAALLLARVYYGGAASVESNHFYQGLLLATVAGATGGVYVYSSGRLYARTHCSTLDILCVRFFLLMALTGLIGRAEISHILTFDLHLFGQLALLSIFSVLVPVFALQHAIHNLGGGRVSIITPCVPALALLLELNLTHWNNLVVPTLVVFVCLAVVMANLWYQREKNQAPALPLAKPA